MWHSLNGKSKLWGTIMQQLRGSGRIPDPHGASFCVDVDPHLLHAFNLHDVLASIAVHAEHATHHAHCRDCGSDLMLLTCI